MKKSEIALCNLFRYVACTIRTDIALIISHARNLSLSYFLQMQPLVRRGLLTRSRPLWGFFFF